MGTPEFIDTDRLRFRSVPLEWPLTAEGRVFAAIRIRRMTAAEVVAFTESLKALPEGAHFMWPIFVAEDGSALPEGLMDALDDDDRETLDRAAMDFLPRRFRGGASAASDPATGANIA